MAVVLWAGLRQIATIRESFSHALTEGSAGPLMHEDNVTDFEEWVKREGLGKVLDGWQGPRYPFPPEMQLQNGHRFMHIWSIATTFLPEMHRVLKEGDIGNEEIDDETEDFGAERSSASYGRWENFVTTSAMLRFLAALEQFEIDALKALLFYRPSGKGAPAAECIEETVDKDVIREQPEIRDQVKYYSMPPLWTWMWRSAENNSERRTIFSRVYNIKLDDPNDFGWKYQELYDMRNAIAHGRASVVITVGDLLKVHNYVIKTMMSTTDKILERYQLRL